jgi:hypothetical protein
MLMNGAIPIPPARKTAGLAVLLWRQKDPIGPSILAATDRQGGYGLLENRISYAGRD